MFRHSPNKIKLLCGCNMWWSYPKLCYGDGLLELDEINMLRVCVMLKSITKNQINRSKSHHY